MSTSKTATKMEPKYVHIATIIVSFLVILATFPSTSRAAFTRKLALVQPPPTVLKYHKGLLLSGNVNVNIIWYGKFTVKQRAILVDFVQSLSHRAWVNGKSPPSHTIAGWWTTTGKYSGKPCFVTVSKQVSLNKYPLGKNLNDSQLEHLSTKYASPNPNGVNLILTSSDVAVEDFCMNRCGSHGWTGKGKSKTAYAWVGNSVTQCPGQCAWPFHKPIYGPQTPPLVAPNGDVGVDGMVINVATVLAGAVTNPFDDGYFQGLATMPLEAVTACTGIFGTGAYPGYPGKVLVEKKTKASFNGYGINGREYLVPAMWDPKTSTCKTVV